VKKNKNKEIKIIIKTILIGFFISFIVIIISIPIHEAGHWIMSEIDPYIEPVEYQIFIINGKNNEKHKLNSILGYVSIIEKYPGALKARPIWADLLQEIICISIQIIISFFITIKLIKILEKKHKNNQLIFKY
jgi:hypothetical protein